MRNLLKIIFLLVVVLSCSSKRDILTVELIFGKAFEKPVIYQLDLEKNTLTQTIYRNGNAYINNVGRDTLKAIYNSSYEISWIDSRKFKNSVTLLNSSIQNTQIVLDGYGFGVFIFYTNGDSFSIKNNINKRNDKTKYDFEYLNAFLDLARGTINDSDGRQILRRHEFLYTDGRMDIKKTATNPDEYELNGYYTGNGLDSQRLSNFLSRFPNNYPIILKPNDSSFALLISEVLGSNNNLDNIYCYGIDEALQARNFVRKFEIDSFYGNYIDEKRCRLIKENRNRFNYWKSINCIFKNSDEIKKHLANN